MIKGVIFDLDGVLLSTDDFHYQAWKVLADRENIHFNREINERLRGVSRMESLEIILEKASKQYSDSEKEEMAEFKNNIYRELLNNLTPKDLFPGTKELIDKLIASDIKIAIGSSSKNAKFILNKTGMLEVFAGVISDGTNITRSKPDPEVFLKAAVMIETPNENCLVVEDADAGIIAAKAANMQALAVGSAQGHPQADYETENIMSINKIIENILDTNTN